MSIFGPYCRNKAGLPVETVGGSPAGDPYMGLWADGGEIEAINNGTRHHASNGIPLNPLGLMIVSPGSTITYYDQGVPYSATGNIVTGVGPITYYDQGVGFNAAGEIVTI